MANRLARPMPATLACSRSKRDALLAQACANDDVAGDARLPPDLLRQAREQQRKVLWARRILGWAETALERTPHAPAHLQERTPS